MLGGLSWIRVDHAGLLFAVNLGKEQMVGALVKGEVGGVSF